MQNVAVKKSVLGVEKGIVCCCAKTLSPLMKKQIKRKSQESNESSFNEVVVLLTYF